VPNGEGPPRLSLDQLMVMKLFELCDRMAEQTPDGTFKSGTISVTDQVSEIVGAILKISFRNDGDDDVYIWSNEEPAKKPWLVGDAPIKKKEGAHIDFKKKTGNVVYLLCQSGKTASVRYWKIA